MSRRAFVSRFNSDDSVYGEDLAETIVAYELDGYAPPVAIERAIASKIITEPGTYFVAMPDASYLNLTKFEVEEVPSPSLRIKGRRYD